MSEIFHFHGTEPERPLKVVRTPSLASTQPAFIRWLWPTFYGVLLLVIIVLVLAKLAHAGGPGIVAGASYFDPSTKGVALTWAGGAVNYYTDQGDLSGLLPKASADAFVADAFTRWTGITTAAVSATAAGQLSENVSGTNVIVNSDGSISMPTDTLPSAVTKPVAIVYDDDGAVTDALLGTGAGGSDYCFTNAVFGGPDNLGTDGHYLHALVILNGNCAQTSAQLPDMTYRLVRVLGRTLGLGWSQANLNVITRNPVPGPADYAGFTIMHAADSPGCVPISSCYPNADQPKMDDQAAFSRLYPVTAQNQGNFPGKQIFADNTIRIHGSVYFADASGLPAQAMQGVNVVARWVDPSTGKASRTYVATSVSGFEFRGYAGNPINGYTDSTGLRFDRFGSDDQATEGTFDLAGLQIPDGISSAQYELSVEAMDPLWSQAVGPYGPWQVQPSGAAQPIRVTVSKGGDLAQDILMLGSALPTDDWFASQDYSAPAPVPASGQWSGSLGSYSETEYFRFTGKMDRTLSVEVTALDERGAASETKALPVVGIWALADPPGTLPPAATPMAFNTYNFGVTRLDASLLTSTDFRVGVSDFRGDGRPDYRYQARILYGDTVTPARASVAGNTPVMVQGYGMRAGTAVTVGSTSAPVLSVSANQIIAAASAMADGVQTVTLADPASGASSVMTNVLTYGAGATDGIRLISGSNPSTPLGEEAANPIVVRVLSADGTTPVAGASVVWSASAAVGFSACAGAATCTVISDGSGQVSTRVTVLFVGTITLTATLAPASYPTPKLVQTTVRGTSSSLDLSVTAPYQLLAQGATLDIPIAARLLNNGSPISGRTINYALTKGTGTLSLLTTTSDANGYVTSTLHVSALASDVQVSVCVEPGDSPCQSFYGTSVATTSLQLEPVSGSDQAVATGQSFAPVTVRVTNAAVPPSPVRGATVLFQALIMRPDRDAPIEWAGGEIIGHNAMPVILGSVQVSAISDLDGLATYQPSLGAIHSAAEIEGSATAGAGTVTYELEALTPGTDPGQQPGLPTVKPAASQKGRTTE